MKSRVRHLHHTGIRPHYSIRDLSTYDKLCAAGVERLRDWNNPASHLICNKLALLRTPPEPLVGCLCKSTATRMPKITAACATCVFSILRFAQAQQAGTAIPGRQVSYLTTRC